MIIGLTGKIGSGKTTAARILRELYNFDEYTFKSEMIRALCVLFEVSSDFFENRDTKETPSDTLFGKTPREVMQSFGTEWARNSIHPDIWVSKLMQKRPEDKKVVISDVRFDNEAAAIRERGGIVVQLNRLDNPYPVSSHASEDGISNRMIDHHLTFCDPTGEELELRDKLHDLVGQAAIKSAFRKINNRDD